jgi:A/G-specific adenine glycosylase
MRIQLLSLDVRKRIPWFRHRLRIWFRDNHRSFPWRSKDRTPYEILIAEILLRRTKAETVARIYPIFLSRFPNFNSLAGARIGDLQRALKPLGLWRQKTPILLTIARAVKTNGGNLPTTRQGLEGLFHVGDYIASVILTTFHNQPEPFVDVNMARVVDRFFGPRKLVDIRYDPYLRAVAKRLVDVRVDSLLVNWAVLDFAALVCKAGRPRCEICPMKLHCVYFRQISP